MDNVSHVIPGAVNTYKVKEMNDRPVWGHILQIRLAKKYKYGRGLLGNLKDLKMQRQ